MKIVTFLHLRVHHCINGRFLESFMIFSFMYREINLDSSPESKGISRYCLIQSIVGSIYMAGTPALRIGPRRHLFPRSIFRRNIEIVIDDLADYTYDLRPFVFD